MKRQRPTLIGILVIILQSGVFAQIQIPDSPEFVEFSFTDKFGREEISSKEIKGDSIYEKVCSPVYNTPDSCFRSDPYKIEIVGDTVFVRIKWVGGDKVPYAILRKGDSHRSFNLEQFVMPHYVARVRSLNTRAVYMGRANLKLDGVTFKCYRFRFVEPPYNVVPYSDYEILYSVDTFLPLKYAYFKEEKPKRLNFEIMARKVGRLVKK